MISSEKVRCMTDVALLQKKGMRGEAEACKYRQKDYVTLHMFAVWVSATAAWFLMTAALLLFIFGKNPDQYIAFETVGQVAVLWGMAYVLYCLIFFWVAWICYSTRYRKAKKWQRQYQYAVQCLEKYYMTSAESDNDDVNDDVWLVSSEEGNRKGL